MRSFSIEEPGSPVPALYATLKLFKRCKQEGRFALWVCDPEVFQPISNRSLGEKSNLPYFSIPRGVAVLDCDSKSSWLD